MSDTLLNVPYAEKDAAKALGARWNAGLRKWYVPAGIELAPFAAWLPVERAVAVSAETSGSYQLAQVPSDKGLTLSQLLGGVQAAVARAFGSSQWVVVEVSRAQTSRGHVYLELSERTEQGDMLASARGVIWASTASRILPEFQRQTGVEVAAGIKLLVRARPGFHVRYGLSLEIDGIDPDYTLGDLEAKKKQIRLRLQQEGIYTANRQLPAPWDYRHVLVIAPEHAAGLGDFQAEAMRLQQAGVCCFDYAYSRFQGEGAAAEIVATIAQAMQSYAQQTVWPDALVLIRGGGAVNDLAWLNDYALAKTLCMLEIPVLTGIGHERDSTVLDEVAHSSFDTPSKVIGGIAQQIRQRALDVHEFFAEVVRLSTGQIHAQRSGIERNMGLVQSHGQRILATARQTYSEDFATVRWQAQEQLHGSRQLTSTLLEGVQRQAHRQLGEARTQLPLYLTQVSMHSRASVRTARQAVQVRMDAVVERSRVDVRHSREVLHSQLDGVGQEALWQVQDMRRRVPDLFAQLLRDGCQQVHATRQAVEHGIQDICSHADQDLQRMQAQSRQLMEAVADNARRTLHDARQSSTALFREVAGQGPAKTLGRGFALVRDASGQAVTSTRDVQPDEHLHIEFQQGSLSARVLEVNQTALDATTLPQATGSDTDF